jgi:hypothetical protein
VQCPKCGTETYTSGAGLEICPECGHGSPTAQATREGGQLAFQEYQRSLAESPPDRTYRTGAWELRVVYKARGSKSEGAHGELFKDGESLATGEVGEILQTALGPLKYYGSPEDLIPTWQVTGWHFADQDLIVPSWEEDENPALVE